MMPELSFGNSSCRADCRTGAAVDTCIADGVGGAFLNSVNGTFTLAGAAGCAFVTYLVHIFLLSRVVSSQQFYNTNCEASTLNCCLTNIYIDTQSQLETYGKNP